MRPTRIMKMPVNQGIANGAHEGTILFPGRKKGVLPDVSRKLTIFHFCLKRHWVLGIRLHEG
jgi:hypothetical protein